MVSGRWKRIAAIASAVGTIAATYAVAFSPLMYTVRHDPGTIATCGITNDRHINPRGGDNDEVWEQAGEVAFMWMENSEEGDVPGWSRIRAQAVELRGHSPTYGPYSVRLDPSRPLDSWIRSLGTEELPAASTLTFHAVLQFDEQPGISYYTIDSSPISMHNPSLNEWPHSETRYDQQGDVIFVNPDNPAEPVVLREGSLYTTAH